MYPPQMINAAEKVLKSLGFEFRVVDKKAKFVNDKTEEIISFYDAPGILFDDGRLKGWRVTGGGVWKPVK